MPQDRNCNSEVGRRLLARTVLSGALAATMLFAGTAARADDDGPSVISSIMHTLGFQAPGDTYSGIDYNERSPLVVPPTRDLPPPASNTAPPVANWPKDVDVARKKQAKVDNSAHYQSGDSVTNDARVLSPKRARPAGRSEGQTPVAMAIQPRIRRWRTRAITAPRRACSAACSRKIHSTRLLPANRRVHR